MTALHDLTALEQAAAVRAGEVTPTELAAHHLDRIADLDDDLRAFVTVAEDLAMASAAEAEAALAAGHDVGPLHGVPVAVKDVARIDGVACSFGSVVHAGEPADIDDHVVARLKAAGLVVLGTTNTPEFALPCHTVNDVVGATRNPWSPAHTPGGSSGGSAAAVAARLVPLAHGTDAAGSVRIPAAACGVVGAKPSRGRVSNGPVDHDVSGLSEHGALARTVADAAALLAAMSGPMPGDTATAPAAAVPDRPLRIAALYEPMLPDVVAADVSLSAAETAARSLVDAGHEVDVVPVGPDQAVADAFRLVRAVHAASIPVEPEDEERLQPFTRWLRAQGRSVPATALHEALQTFRGIGQMMADLFLATWDLVLTPSLATPPPPLHAFTGPDQGVNFDAMSAFMPYTPLANIAGLPSTSVPVTVTSDGLPLGALLTGRWGEEAVVDAAATVVQAAAAVGPPPDRPATIGARPASELAAPQPAGRS